MSDPRPTIKHLLMDALIDSSESIHCSAEHALEYSGRPFSKTIEGQVHWFRENKFPDLDHPTISHYSEYYPQWREQISIDEMSSWGYKVLPQGRTDVAIYMDTDWPTHLKTLSTINYSYKKCHLLWDIEVSKGLNILEDIGYFSFLSINKQSRLHHNPELYNVTNEWLKGTSRATPYLMLPMTLWMRENLYCIIFKEQQKTVGYMLLARGECATYVIECAHYREPHQLKARLGGSMLAHTIRWCYDNSVNILNIGVDMPYKRLWKGKLVHYPNFR